MRLGVHTRAHTAHQGRGQNSACKSSAHPTTQGGRSSARRMPTHQTQASSPQNINLRSAQVAPPCGAPCPRHLRPAHVHSSGPPCPARQGMPPVSQRDCSECKHAGARAAAPAHGGKAPWGLESCYAAAPACSRLPAPPSSRRLQTLCPDRLILHTGQTRGPAAGGDTQRKSSCAAAATETRRAAALAQASAATRLRFRGPGHSRSEGRVRCGDCGEPFTAMPLATAAAAAAAALSPLCMMSFNTCMYVA